MNSQQVGNKERLFRIWKLLFRSAQKHLLYMFVITKVKFRHSPSTFMIEETITNFIV
jgi:hypothetical protein